MVAMHASLLASSMTAQAWPRSHVAISWRMFGNPGFRRLRGTCSWAVTPSGRSSSFDTAVRVLGLGKSQAPHRLLYAPSLTPLKTNLQTVAVELIRSSEAALLTDV